MLTALSKIHFPTALVAARDEIVYGFGAGCIEHGVDVDIRVGSSSVCHKDLLTQTKESVYVRARQRNCHYSSFIGSKQVQYVLVSTE